mgnify:CR=1 FL=1
MRLLLNRDSVLTARHTLFVFLHLAFALGVVLYFLFSAPSAGAKSANGSSPSPNAQVYDCKAGPWGRIQWHYVHIEAPDWIVANTLLPHSQPSWSFPGASVDDLKRFLVMTGVATSTVNGWLADNRAILHGPESITIFPSVPEVEALGDAARRTIYEELAKSQMNEYYANPIYILDRSVEDWIGLRKVRPEILDLIKRLAYQRGDVLCFSDLSVLMAHAQSDAEARDLAKLGTRKRAIMAYLQVSPSEDFEKLEAYWSAAYRRKDVLPILTSISQLPGGGRLGLSHLLPAQPRKLIYTYPTLDLATTGRLPDCHWTTFNFFSFYPQNIYLDLRLAADRLLEGYDPVEPPYKYGDALIFLNKAGDAIHSCVYLCDDLVFTKNGETISAPWIISQIGDVQRLYAHLGLNRIQGYRRRWDQER